MSHFRCETGGMVQEVDSPCPEGGRAHPGRLQEVRCCAQRGVPMKLPREDVLNAILTDLVADQIIRALQLGFSRKEVEAAVARGVGHGVYEFSEYRTEMRKT